MSERDIRLRSWLLGVNYGIAAVVFILFLLTAKGFSVVEWLTCFVLMVLTPLGATYIQLTQIGLGRKLFSFFARR